MAQGTWAALYIGQEHVLFRFDLDYLGLRPKYYNMIKYRMTYVT